MLSFLHLVTLCALFAALKATQPECIVGAVDLAFVIDGSQSVGSTNFKTVLDAVVQATRLTNIGPLEEDSRVAMVIFDETAHVEFGLMNTTNADVEAAILRSKYTNINGVNIAAGMDAAVRKVTL
uniref:VWFA domain-containing protein n=1 Tax=Parascaris equorum TaxID=6256 RepID=A0A914RL81_PAREQ